MLECRLCPHRCRLRDGQVGFCQVRRRNGDRLETATFATTVQHIDPVERKPLYHWRPGSSLLTLAAPGCTFRCGYCVNFRLSQFGRTGGVEWQAESVTPAEIADRARRAGCAVAFSYTEPSLAIELTLALARESVPIVWKTNGFLTPEAIEVAAPAVQAMNVDLKASDDRGHRELTGASLAPVLDSIAELKARGVWLEVSTPLIPGVSDDPRQIRAIARSLADIDPAIPWHVLRFTPTYRMAEHNPSAPELLAEAAAAGHEAGLKYVYVERALGPAGRATFCPRCGSAAVERGIWATNAVHLIDGRCPSCDYAIEGVWDTP